MARRGVAVQGPWNTNRYTTIRSISSIGILRVSACRPQSPVRDTPRGSFDGFRLTFFSRDLLTNPLATRRIPLPGCHQLFKSFLASYPFPLHSEEPLFLSPFFFFFSSSFYSIITISYYVHLQCILISVKNFDIPLVGEYVAFWQEFRSSASPPSTVCGCND